MFDRCEIKQNVCTSAYQVYKNTLIMLFVSEKFVIQTEDLTYYISSPFWMKCRLLLFWILWAALIMAIIISILTYFCFIPRTCHNSNIQRSWHEKHEHEQIGKYLKENVN